jgi:hypothetical protein
MDKPLYRLPSGNNTTEPQAYINAWRALSDKVAEGLGDGWVVTGFDPDVVISRGVQTLALPLCAAVALGNLVDELHILRERLELPPGVPYKG